MRSTARATGEGGFCFLWEGGWTILAAAVEGDGLRGEEGEGEARCRQLWSASCRRLRLKAGTTHSSQHTHTPLNTRNRVAKQQQHKQRNSEADIHCGPGHRCVPSAAFPQFKACRPDDLKALLG